MLRRGTGYQSLSQDEATEKCELYVYVIYLHMVYIHRMPGGISRVVILVSVLGLPRCAHCWGGKH